MGKAIIISDLVSSLSLGTVTIGSETPPVVIAVTGVSINNKPSSITDGIQLSVGYTPSDTTQKGVIWSSSDTSVATVSSSGYVTVKKAGSVTITATSTYMSSIKDNFTATCSVTSTYIPVTSVSVAGSTSGKVGNTIQLSATVLPSNATNKSVNWVSSNEGIATVSSSGLVNLLSTGDVTITAISASETGITDTHSITVSEESVNPPSPSEYPTDGLIVHLDAAGMSNPTTRWNDLSGNGNDFILTEFLGTSDNGWGDNELVFAETDPGYCLNEKLNDGGLGDGIEGEVTVFMKVKNNNSLGLTRIYCASINSGDNKNFSLGLAADGAFVKIAGKNYKLANSMVVGTYYVVGVRIAGTVAKIYLNDKALDIPEAPASRYNAIGKTTIGTYLNQWGSRGEKLYGAVKKAVVYNRAVTDEEVAMIISLMNQ